MFNANINTEQTTTTEFRKIMLYPNTAHENQKSCWQIWLRNSCNHDCFFLSIFYLKIYYIIFFILKKLFLITTYQNNK